MKKYFIRKYRYAGMYTEWKEVTREVALHKSQVEVDGYCPYEVIHIESIEAFEKGDFYVQWEAHRLD